MQPPRCRDLRPHGLDQPRGSFQYDETLTLQFYEYFKRLVTDGQFQRRRGGFLRASVMNCERYDPLLWSSEDDTAG